LIFFTVTEDLSWRNPTCVEQSAILLVSGHQLWTV